MDKEYRIVLYIRISVEDEECRDGIRDESNSISNQRDLLRSYVERCKEFGGCEVIELCDDGFSGTNMERPNMQKLINKAKAKEIDCIIVKDFSRFGRDYLVVSDYVDQIFPFLGIRFISVNDSYDSMKMQGKTSGVDIAFRNVIYSYYSKDLSMKVRSGLRTKALRGDFLSPFAPIGYCKDKKDRNQLVIEEESAGIVRHIFELAGMGISAQEITRLFNAEKVPTPSTLKNGQGYYHKWWQGVKGVNLWHENTITRILRDERYLGKTVYGKRYRPQVGNRKTIKNTRLDWIIKEKQHEPIICEEEFKAVQDKLVEYVEKDVMKAREYLFTGKLRCGHCGYSLTRYAKPIPRFLCNTKHRVTGFGCMDGNIKEFEIADVVLASIQAYIKVLMNEKDLLIKSGSGDRLANLQKQVAIYQGASGKIDEKKAELYDAMAEGRISKEQYKRKRDRLSWEQKDLIQQAKVAEMELVELRVKLAATKQGEPKLMGYLQTDILTRQMVVDLVDYIYVYSDKNIRIKWTFKKSD